MKRAVQFCLHVLVASILLGGNYCTMTTTAGVAVVEVSASEGVCDGWAWLIST